ncbi:MAG: pyrroline-5-carboxylate reductase [Flavobacterium sp. BFFFF2]|nr:MAG: pyrroline-5-carboxylate reductase [Flavobacterium sp. BFFFF2]
MKIAIIGLGNMGKTYLNSFWATRFFQPEDMLLVVRDLKKYADQSAWNRFPMTDQIQANLGEYDLVLIAVKPQDFPALAKQIQPFIKPQQLIVSVMAGVSLLQLQEQLQAPKVIRAMPNLPSQLGQGMTVFTASAAIDRKELFLIQNIINTTGKSIFVEEERLVDAATAVSGSGPAYVFFLMQSLIEAAVKLGFKPSEAELLVHQTFLGSIQLQNSQSLSLPEWIQKVASKGGTTEQALLVFEKEHTRENLIKAVEAAYKRACELGK